MKKLKRIMALVIAMAMIIGTMSMTAFAADPTGSITVKPSDTVSLENKTLKAYKIMDATYGSTGTLGGDPAQAVSYTIPAALIGFYNEYFGQKADDTVDPPVPAKTASDLAAAAGKTLDVFVTDAMKDWGDNSAKIKDFSSAALAAAKAARISPISGVADDPNVKFSGLAAGYYVIEDEGTATPISALMLDTVTNANVDITLKASDVTQKKIKTVGELTNEKANELGVGRVVNYEITQAIPDTTGYDYYYYMFNDTMSSGLTFDPASVVVKVGNTTLDKDTDYYLYADATRDAAVLNGKTFIIAFEDVVKGIADKKYKTGDVVTITYSATVNSSAITGVDPNKNDANIQYSNNPDKDERKDKTNYPGIPANTTDTPTGEGPHKFTDTYTTKLTITKYDASTNTKTVLPGVEFTLTGTSKDAVFKDEEVFEIDPAGTYWLLKNGKYTLDAPTTEATVRETTGGAGWVEIVSGDTYAGADIRVIGTKKYRPYVKETDSALTRYIIVEPNDDNYASITTKYAKVKKNADAAEEYTVSRTGLTGDDGTLAFAQLGAGSYKLSETGVLAGFNGIADITFDIAVTLPKAEDVIAGTEKATWAVTNVKNGEITYNEATGEFTITIDNKKGTELPSTGGIGTTIFYIVGAALVLGAGVVMITRRRMGE